METNVLLPQELLSCYEKQPNGDVYIGSMLITNVCTDGTMLWDALNWIILDRYGNIFLDSRADTSEFQREGCIYKKVSNAEAIAAFIRNHRHRITNIRVAMQVYENVITILE